MTATIKVCLICRWLSNHFCCFCSFRMANICTKRMAQLNEEKQPLTNTDASPHASHSIHFSFYFCIDDSNANVDLRDVWKFKMWKARNVLSNAWAFEKLSRGLVGQTSSSNFPKAKSFIVTADTNVVTFVSIVHSSHSSLFNDHFIQFNSRFISRLSFVYFVLFLRAFMLCRFAFIHWHHKTTSFSNSMLTLFFALLCLLQCALFHSVRALCRCHSISHLFINVIQ